MKRKILIPLQQYEKYANLNHEEIAERKLEKDGGSDEECPICGQRLGFPALSRFDNETEICSECGHIEGTGFLFSCFSDKQRHMLKSKRWQHDAGLSDWEAHCIVINAIAGSRRGIAKKMNQSFEQLRHYEALRAKVMSGEITEKELSKYMKQD